MVSPHLRRRGAVLVLWNTSEVECVADLKHGWLECLGTLEMAEQIGPGVHLLGQPYTMVCDVRNWIFFAAIACSNLKRKILYDRATYREWDDKCLAPRLRSAGGPRNTSRHAASEQFVHGAAPTSVVGWFHYCRRGERTSSKCSGAVSCFLFLFPLFPALKWLWLCLESTLPKRLVYWRQTERSK